LTPRLARSVGFLPVFFPPEGRLGHAPVQAQPVPLEPLEVIVRQQAGLPEALKDADRDPFLEAVVGGGAGTEACRVERFPLAAGAQDEQNGLHAHAVVLAWPAATEAVGIAMHGQQFLHGLPDVRGDMPLVHDRDIPCRDRLHDAPPLFQTGERNACSL
jgi:hypothetical protein